ncbi:MAG: thiol-disulfide oxidoreductase DCC family protein [Thermaurantimonas sp.]|uniref:Thiol-disulfide oxidoreductase n=1 Tax=Thermaurantimonas aggregans TaxID=2173829 RepID=A0A401XJ50_9FLAO|nr:DCC1-like thiol-disulfide oxidoreductase family protein [Thermaurantimonas aggregans]MCX8148955.1 DCC1-like thiol-disulfide oxidoreductase family protein [Thermaurantimonas aggregans]GCD77030.1 hypothetical protein JCM31826_05120 [Thermaurantimonas aggregans]
MNKDTEKVIVFIDAQCVLCDFLSKVILWADKKDYFRIASLTGETYRMLAQNPQPPNQLQYVEVYSHGRWFDGPMAIFEILRTLGFPYSIFLVFKLLPTKINWFLYRYVAKKRFAWFGRKEICSLESSQNLKKILP